MKTVILRKYKAVKDKCNKLNTKIKDYENALKFMGLERRIKELDREIVNPNLFKRKRNNMKEEKNQIADEIKALGDIRYKLYTVRKVRELLSKKKTELKEQEKIKSELEKESVFARDSYDISEIISIIETLNK